MGVHACFYVLCAVARVRVVCVCVGGRVFVGVCIARCCVFAPQLVVERMHIRNQIENSPSRFQTLAIKKTRRLRQLLQDSDPLQPCVALA